MATTLALTTSYAGKQTLPYFHSAFLALHSLSNGMFKVVPNIEGKAVVPVMALSGSTIVDATCDFTPVGTVTITERILTPELFDIPKQLCKKDFVADWEVQEMLPGAKLGQPKNAVEALIINMLGTSMQTLESTLYSGVNATAGEFDGLETLLTVDAALPPAQEVTGIAVTTLNVVDEIGKVIDATPDAIRDQTDYHIGVSSAIFYKLVRSQGGFLTGGIGAAGIDNKGVTWHDGRDMIMFEGIPVLRCPGMTATVMIATYTENVWFGTSLMSDLNTIATKDMYEVDLSRNIRFLGSYFAGVQYGSATQVVTYGIVNAAN